MKGTEQFKQTIKDHLDNRAKTDDQFAISYKKENKNLDNCIKYILNTVQKSGNNGFEDAEIYSMAIHYYDEDTLDPGKDLSKMHIVVNHHVELTEEEKKEAHGNAKKRAEDEAYAKLTAKPKTKKKVAVTEEKQAIPQQQSLF